MKQILAALCCLAISGCASVGPAALTDEELRAMAAQATVNANAQCRAIHAEETPEFQTCTRSNTDRIIAQMVSVEYRARGLAAEANAERWANTRAAIAVFGGALSAGATAYGNAYSYQQPVYQAPVTCFSNRVGRYQQINCY
jgi:hypothetical protein